MVNVIGKFNIKLSFTQLLLGVIAAAFTFQSQGVGIHYPSNPQPIEIVFNAFARAKESNFSERFNVSQFVELTALTFLKPYLPLHYLQQHTNIETETFYVIRAGPFKSLLNT